MKISIFTTASRGSSAGDLYEQAKECYKDLADKVIVNDRPWPQEFSWPHIGQSFQAGYESCPDGWCIRLDLDMLFHQKDFDKIRQALRDYPDAPAISFYKHQYIQPHKYNLKSRLMLAANKKVFGDRITFSGGGDLCGIQLDGKDLDLNEMPQAGVPVWNYEHLLKTEAQIRDDIGRMDRAYHRHFGRWLYSEDGTEDSAYKGWWHMIEGRYNKPQEEVKLEQHPKYMIETIRKLRPDQFGYNGFERLRGGYFEK